MEFTIANVISLAGVIITFVMAVLGIYIKLNVRLNSIESIAAERSVKNAGDLAAYKLSVAEKYVQAEAMTRIEERMTGAITALTDRLDRLITTLTP